MDLSTQDILAIMGGGDENFHGTELDPEKVAAFDQLKAHAAALARLFRTAWNASEPDERERHVMVYVDFPPQLNILNASVRTRISELYRLADAVSYSTGSCLRMVFFVVNIWKV